MALRLHFGDISLQITTQKGLQKPPTVGMSRYLKEEMEERRQGETGLLVQVVFGAWGGAMRLCTLEMLSEEGSARGWAGRPGLVLAARFLCLPGRSCSQDT